MARSLKHERQLLSTDELTLVENSHHPALGLLPDHDLAELRKLVRERRDRAQTIAARQRRELRGKAAPKGVRAATDDSGTREKRDLLAAALRRLNKEVSRREAKAAKQDLIGSAQRSILKRRQPIRYANRRSSARSASATRTCRPSAIRDRPQIPAFTSTAPGKIGLNNGDGIGNARRQWPQGQHFRAIPHISHRSPSAGL